MKLYWKYNLLLLVNFILQNMKKGNNKLYKLKKNGKNICLIIVLYLYLNRRSLNIL